MGEPGLELVSRRRRRDRSAATGPDAQHRGSARRKGGGPSRGWGSPIRITTSREVRYGGQCGGAGGQRTRHLRNQARDKQNKNIFLTAYAGGGSVRYSGRMAPAANRPPLLPPSPEQPFWSARAVRAHARFLKWSRNVFSRLVPAAREGRSRPAARHRRRDRRDARPLG